MPPIGDLLAQISGEPSPIQATCPPLPKRKASEQLRKPVDKLPKTDEPAADYFQPPSPISRTSKVSNSIAGMMLSTKDKPAKPAAKPTAKPAAKPATKPAAKPAARHSASTTIIKNGQPTPPPANDAPKPAPKKGSFAEIMARGKAAQSTLGQVGKIQHKRIEKMPSKREKEELKAQKSSNLQKNLDPESKFSKMAPSMARNGQSVKDNGKVGQSGARQGGKGRPEPEQPEKKIKKAATATTGYTGTSRPKPGGSASKPSASASSSRYDRGPDRDRRRTNDRYGGARYAYTSEEEDEEEEEEEEQEYESDLSDMEAAAFEVDDEEEEAARIARREDALALAEENRLKREKEEKRRKLTAMAKAKSNKR
ncbi:hypothetical protein LZ554_007881 [Drepanopeziza brunnea f. sp. 'monogermtubi']|nr:hypothetical protein LZ554_007881 [Drepanopeziza brunnea f. sp. 'monogermtubi']